MKHRFFHSFSALLALRLLWSCAAAHGQSTWEVVEGCYGGAVFGLAVDSSGICYASADLALYRSSDEGRSWERMNLPVLPDLDHGMNVGPIAVARDGTVILGQSGHLLSLPPGGGEWIVTPVRTSLNSVTVMPDGDVWATGWGGDDPTLLRSTDNGRTWRGISPKQFDYASQIAALPDGRLIVASGYGLFISRNKGTTWRRVHRSEGFGCLVVTSRGTIVAHRDYDGESPEPIDTVTLYRSSNLGKSWKKTTMGSIDYRWISTFVVDRKGRVHAATLVGTLVSEDDGRTWRRTSQFRTVALTITPSGVLLAAEENRVYRSTDDGATWEEADRGIHSFGVHSIAQASPSTFYAATTDGVRKSTDGGTTWSRNSLTGDIRRILPLPDGTLIVSKRGHKLYELHRSTDEGVTWTEFVVFDPKEFCHYEHMDETVLERDSAGNVYFGSPRGLARSSDNGATWSRIHLVKDDVPLVSMFVDRSGHVLYSTIGMAGVMRPERKVWKGGTAYYQLHSQDRAGTIYASWAQILNNGRYTQFAVYRTNDTAATWQRLDDGMMDSALVWAVLPTVEGTLLAGAKGKGVMEYAGDGVGWKPVGTELANESVKCLAQLPDGTILAGTAVHGLYRLRPPGTSERPERR